MCHVVYSWWWKRSFEFSSGRVHMASSSRLRVTTWFTGAQKKGCLTKMHSSRLNILTTKLVLYYGPHAFSHADVKEKEEGTMSTCWELLHAWVQYSCYSVTAVGCLLKLWLCVRYCTVGTVIYRTSMPRLELASYANHPLGFSNGIQPFLKCVTTYCRKTHCGPKPA